MLGLPKAGWVKPANTNMGTINLMQYGEISEVEKRKKLIRGVITILETKKAEVLMKKPANDRLKFENLYLIC